MHTGPKFILKLYDILVKFIAHPITITADTKKAFLINGVAPEDRKLRYLWLRNPFSPGYDIIEFCFTKLMLGLRPFPAILGSIISHHLSKYKDAEINTIQDSLHVNDLVCGANTIEKAFIIYCTAKSVLLGWFNLHKWSSNSVEILHRIQVAESVLSDRKNHAKDNAVAEEEETYSKSITGY